MTGPWGLLQHVALCLSSWTYYFKEVFCQFFIAQYVLIGFYKRSTALPKQTERFKNFENVAPNSNKLNVGHSRPLFLYYHLFNSAYYAVDSK